MTSPLAKPGLSTIWPARSVMPSSRGCPSGTSLAVNIYPAAGAWSGRVTNRNVIGAIPRLQSHRGQAVRTCHPLRERIRKGRDDHAPGDRALPSDSTLKICVSNPNNFDFVGRERYEPQGLKDRPLLDHRSQRACRRDHCPLNRQERAAPLLLGDHRRGVEQLMGELEHGPRGVRQRGNELKLKRPEPLCRCVVRSTSEHQPRA